MKLLIIATATLIMAGCVSRETTTTTERAPSYPTTTSYPASNQTVSVPVSTTTNAGIPSTGTIDRINATQNNVTYRLIDTGYLNGTNDVALNYCRSVGRSSSRLMNLSWQNGAYTATYQCS